jgi:hypothetical protein
MHWRTRYDVSTFHHGAWTQEFLIRGLMERIGFADADLAQLFHDARTNYVQVHRESGDQPCFFGRTENRCYNTEEAAGNGSVSAVLPTGLFSIKDWIGLL